VCIHSLCLPSNYQGDAAFADREFHMFDDAASCHLLNYEVKYSVIVIAM